VKISKISARKLAEIKAQAEKLVKARGKAMLWFGKAIKDLSESGVATITLNETVHGQMLQHLSKSIRRNLRLAGFDQTVQITYAPVSVELKIGAIGRGATKAEEEEVRLLMEAMLRQEGFNPDGTPIEAPEPAEVEPESDEWSEEDEDFFDEDEEVEDEDEI